MAVLNLRKFPDDLMRELKSESGLSGETLTEYCVRVFRQRGGGQFSKPVAREARSTKASIPSREMAVAHIETRPVDNLLRIPGVAVASDPRYLRPMHDPKTCRLPGCGMCAAAKGGKQ